jgi:hypothetical protein
VKRPPRERPQAESESHWTAQRLSRHSTVSTVIESWRSSSFVSNIVLDDLELIVSDQIFKYVESAVFASLLISFISSVFSTTKASLLFLSSFQFRPSLQTFCIWSLLSC